ncbi:LysM peptidoglycan-binding domain-containing protein, partial [Candidatus Protofrankia datiscae]
HISAPTPVTSTPPGDPLVAPAPRGVGTPGQPTPASPPPSPATQVQDSAVVVVLRGDTLWTIAARHLGAGATTEQIAREWPRWWAANKHVIGSNPDKIFPGQHLQPPPPRP